MSEQEQYQEIGRIVVNSKEASRQLVVSQSRILSLAERLETAAKHIRHVNAGRDYRENFAALTSVPTDNQLIEACKELDLNKQRDSELRTLASSFGINNQPPFAGFGTEQR